MDENVMGTTATASDQGGAPTIEIAAHAGTCYGVQRALDMALAAAPQAGESAQVHTLGPLIHNPIVVRELAEAGIGLAETLNDAASGTVIIRAHGVVPQVIEAAHDRGLTVVDATCPYVKKVHMAAERLVREGYHVVVVGEPGHPEVEGILGHAGDDAQVVSCAADADALPLKGKVGLVVQTTQTAQNLADVVAAITPRVQELRVINTICAATSERQQAAAALANRCDCMVVVGGKNSGNTRRLAQICADACEHTYHIEETSELQAAWFTDAHHIGITAGASTPQEHIERAVTRIKELCC
ncbi:4-hydroxy-3-methylbut-2-enyl diphosphate reductase [Collinsella sp. BG-O-102]|uniref:4-hydroxy-3-methylbut-2-enyl diphosphate reductase n=1 Tax=Collinsella sp. BG-O-102 TaxID=2949659 RepID=UPI00203051F8|nr:4-hydroxy-3-methylbut-2-enyl diphosphate reductase [Collinsella sp. BG-O-102]MCM0710907.1 4-hydroxy-3-methylbut-2-enyl diphosphate reductase [Collinsella sp. BG-O-102]